MTTQPANDLYAEGIPVAPKPVPTMSLKSGRTALDDFLKSETREHPLPQHLRAIVERERDTIHRELVARGNNEPNASAATGPVLAILIDSPLMTVSDAELPKWVRTVMRTTGQTSHIRPLIWVPLVLLLGAGAGGAYMYHLAINPMVLIFILMMVVTMVSMGRPKDGPRYDPIEFDDALALAQYRRQTPINSASHSRLRLRTPTGQTNPQPTATPASLPDMPTSIGTHTEQQELPKFRPSSPAASPRRPRSQRIAEVHAAIAELDQEWLEYELDLRAWFLTKPQLRNNNDPVIAAYRDAYATLRDKAEELNDTATEHQIADAQHAARTALKTWHDANDHAQARGVNNLSPSESAALTRLYGLVSQLNDPATPKAMWPQLIATITRTMDKLTTVPFTLDYIAKQPVIEVESRLRELAP